MPIPNSKGNPFIGGVKYTRVGKIGDFRRKSPFISETVRDRPMTTMELGFVSYTEDVVDLMDSHNVQFHLYADDTQFLDCCRSTDTASLRARLSNCASDIDLWCRSRRLQLNASKTEAIWFGSKPNLGKISSTDCSIQVGASTIQPSAIVRDLGFHLDIELSMKQHVAKVAAANFDHTPLATDSSSRRRGHHPASSPSSCSSHILA